MRNAFAALVAIVCWAGLAIQFAATYGHHHQLVTTIWILGRFFTIVTNLIVAGVMTWVATGGRAPPLLLGGVTLASLLVGVVYGTLLHGSQSLQGPAVIANTLLHVVSPVLMAAWWLLFAPRARLKWNAPWLWTIYPLVYFAYVLARVRAGDHYPYPFIDMPRIGWVQTALNAGGIALGFILAGFLLVWIDSWRPLGSKKANG
ncbi:MAG TPA: Pr6Pr family membrane protein [Ramlibacter sp.]